MSWLSCRLTVVVFSCALACTLAGFSSQLVLAQSAASHGVSENLAAVELPDAPRPQFEVATPIAADVSASNAESNDDQQQTGTGTTSSSQQSDSTQKKQTDSAQTPPQQKSGHDIAEDQLKEQEKQRVVGVVPSFNVSYRPDAVALTAGQKFKLALKSTTDPVTFATAFLTGGYHEVDDNTGFEWGPAGYFERVGAGYLDAFTSTMIGNALFPSILHQDPRFFRMGHGSKTKRFFYAAATSFICKGDKSRNWQPNYSNVLGNIAAGEISNYYYPSGKPGDFDTTISTAMIQTVEGSIGSVFQEFWPDISRKLFHKDPTHGIDALYQNADADAKAKKTQQ